MDKELIILVGNIGAGKTTLTLKYYKKGYIIVSLDMLRYSIGNGNYIYNIKYEPIIYSTGYYMFKKFCKKGINIVIDETNMTKCIREKYIKYAKNFGYKITAIILPKISQEESVKRRLNNPHGNFNKTTWKKVWSGFNRSYQEPTKKEGFDKVIKL